MPDYFEMFTVLMSKLSYQIKKIKSEEMEKFNLKGTHLSCLYYLFKNKELTATELCDICNEDKASISRSVEYLEKEKYLICESKTEKRYKSLIHLTQKGEEIAKSIFQKIDGIVEMASTGLSDTDREIMYRALKLISGNLNKMNDEVH